jgi:ABC-2 type transport system ATP-binding protein
MEQVEEICEQIVLMNKGKIILNDTVLNAKKQFQKGAYILRGERLENLPPENELYSGERLINKEFKFCLKEGKKTKELLAYLSNQDIELSSLAIDTPTLNEIFIELVKGDNS